MSAILCQQTFICTDEIAFRKNEGMITFNENKMYHEIKSHSKYK